MEVAPPSHISHAQKSLADKMLEKVRNSRFFTISLLIHMLLVMSVGSLVLFRTVQEQEDFTAGGGGGFVGNENPNPGPQEPQQPLMPQADAMPAPAAAAITPANALDVISTMAPTASNFAMVVTPSLPSPPSDTANVLPTAGKQPASGGGLPGGLPSTMQGRGGPGRDKARRDKGGKDKSEQAVMAGLRYLKLKQNADGTWGGNTYKGAMTGLALLCYLGHGETYFSVEFGETVKKAVDALVKEGTVQAGRLAFTGSSMANQNAPYQHGIAVYALAESYTLTKDDRIPAVLTQAVAYIVNGQGADGGWMYRYDRTTPSDTSVGGWQIQALKAAHLTGLTFPGIDESLNKAMTNLERVFDEKGKHFGYRNKGDRQGSLDGVGALNFLMWKEQRAGIVRESIKSILDGKPVNYHGDGAHLYAWYYNTQACLMYGGGSWDKWNKMFQDQIADNQNPDGSWPPCRGKSEGHGPETTADLDGAVYRTTLCVLMLEVFYRYLPTVKS